MRLNLPNSAHLQNIEGFLRRYSPSGERQLDVGFHDRYVHVHPFALAMAACAGELMHMKGARTRGRVPDLSSMPYLIRMGLFEYLRVSPPREISEHEGSGRFVPLTQIRTSGELQNVIVNLIPLLHAPAEVADPIKYVFSEMVRNVLEHSKSPVGAFVCAQYYRKDDRLSIGIADAGIGIQKSIRRSHRANSARAAIELALRPGISGATSRIGGNEFNAGAGLFFTKSIAALSGNFFALYSGDTLFKLLRTPEGQIRELHPDPTEDRHKFTEGLPVWQGTVVGINISVRPDEAFSDLMSTIYKSYKIDVKKKKKDFFKQIRFTR